MEKFDNKFHQKYVSGEGTIKEVRQEPVTTDMVTGMSLDDILAEYRWYVGDSTAQLPKEVLERLIITGKV
jgi:hypothetical protein